MKSKITIEYNGAAYAGWQRQKSGITIQSTIEDVLFNIFKKRVVIFGAGRTDSGVHAQGQVAHFSATRRFTEDKWKVLLNSNLPRDIRITDFKFVSPSFHAQKWVVSKIYTYTILNRHSSSPLRPNVYFYARKLDWDKIKEAIPYFLGEHDFSSFQGAKSTVSTTIRKILRFELKEEPNGFYCFEVEGNGFLKHMVRSMVGTLVEVGEGRRKPQDIKEILLAKNRQSAGRTLPPYGLCLLSIQHAGI